jgi:hypothetical protein
MIVYGEMGKKQSSSKCGYKEIVRKAMKLAGHLLSWLRFETGSL